MAAVTAGDAEAVGVAAAAFAVGHQDQFGRDNRSFAAISEYNWASVGALCFAPDGLAGSGS